MTSAEQSSSADLIGMADIAELAGESRSTVGNWKRRYPDFPHERGRNARGPLYNLTEVQAWLATRMDAPGESGEMLAWQLQRVLRDAGVRNPLPLILAIFAAIKIGGKQWIHRTVSHPEAAREDILSALPKLTVAERELLQALIRHVPPETITMITHLIAAEHSGRDLGTTVSALMDAFTRFDRGEAEGATPSSVIDLIVGLAAPHGVVYDPCVGTGRLLVRAVQAAQSANNVLHKAAGQEISAERALIARLYFMVCDVDVALEPGDVFHHDAHPGLAADCIVADPPLGQPVRLDTVDRDDPRWLYGDPSPSDGTALWVQHIAYHLAPTGRAVMLVANSVLAGGVRGRVFQRIIKADLLDAVIGLPAGIVPAAKSAPALLVLRRDRSNKASQGTPGPLLMIDIHQDPPEARARPVLAAETVKATTAQYESWSAKGTPVAGPPAAVVTYGTLVDNDFDLHPRRYTTVATPSVSSNALKKERKKVEAELSALLQQCASVDSALDESLRAGRS